VCDILYNTRILAFLPYYPEVQLNVLLNCSGDKLVLLFLKGTSKKPHFFKNNPIEQIPKDYGYYTKHNAQNQKHKCVEQIRKVKRRMKNLILKSTVTCPKCRQQTEEEMPTDACQYFYQCQNCKEILHPNSGDCCVYCSFGSVKCPSIQEKED